MFEDGGMMGKWGWRVPKGSFEGHLTSRVPKKCYIYKRHSALVSEKSCVCITYTVGLVTLRGICKDLGKCCQSIM